MSTSWGAASTKTAWATQVEEEEMEHGGQLPQLFGGTEAFPSLGEAVKQEPKKKKKVTLTLGEFHQGDAARASSRGYDDVHVLSALPKGPRQRAEGEGENGLGGGFKDYGRGRGGFGDRYGDRSGDRDDRGDRRQRDEDVGPSRADQSDSWGAEKKFVPSYDDKPRGGGFSDRGGGFSDRDRFDSRRERDMGPSRADEVDNWGKADRPPSRGFSGGGGGFDRRNDSGFERRRDYDRPGRGFGREYDLGSNKADSADNWTRREDSSRGFDKDSSRGFDRDRDGRDSKRWNSRGRDFEWPEKSADRPPSVEGVRAPSSERPKLNLLPRTAPVERAPTPTTDPSAPPKKSNPFGAARPREEVLKEKGKDWVKEDLMLEHKAVDRPETTEEKALRQTIDELKQRLDAGEGNEHVLIEQLDKETSVTAAVTDLEDKLLKLSLKLDDEVRFAKPGREQRHW